MTEPNCAGVAHDLIGSAPRRPRAHTLSAALAAAALFATIACGSATDPGGEQNGQQNGQPNGQQLTHPAGTQSAKLVLDHGGYGVALSSNGMLAVTLSNEASLALFPASGSFAGQTPISLNALPLDVLFNHAGSTAYVATSSRLYTIDVATKTVKSFLGFSTPLYRLAYAPDESRIYAVGGSSTVWSIPPAGGAPTSVHLTGALSGIALSPSGKTLYAGNVNGTVYRIDPSTLTVTATGTGAGQFQEDLVVSQDEKQVYAVADNGVLMAMDATTLARIGYVDVGADAVAMALTPDGTQLWVTSVRGSLVIVDRATRTVVKTITLDGVPRYIAFDAKGTTALIPNEDGWVDVIK